MTDPEPLPEEETLPKDDDASDTEDDPATTPVDAVTEDAQ